MGHFTITLLAILFSPSLIVDYLLDRGSFKFRGASNAIFSLDDAQAAKGVVTHSRLKLKLVYL